MNSFKLYKNIIKLLIIDIISFFAFIILVIKDKLFKNQNKGIRILLYHSIAKVAKYKDALRMTVPPGLFEKQMNYLLSMGYNVISIKDLLDYISGNRSIDGKKIVLTFDDGYKGSYDCGYNILRKNGLTATYFITYDYIETKAVSSWQNSQSVTWEDILRMASDGIDIGSHSLSHVNLGSISYDLDRLFEEIKSSKEKLEEKLQILVDYFAYPFGCKDSYNKTTEEIVKKSGFKAACINIFGENKKNDNIFQLKRTRIDRNDNLFKLKMKLCGAYDWVDRIKSII